MKAGPVFLFFLAIFLAPDARSQTEMIVKTGPPVIYEKRSLLTALMSEADYRATTAQLARLGFFPSIRRKPDDLSPEARFGFNLNFRGLNLSWAVDGDGRGGYVFYADWNGNGDLTDDGAPLRFQDGAGDGRYFLHYRTMMTAGGAESKPFEIKLELTGETAPGQSAARRSLAFYERTVRRGKISLGGRGGRNRFRVDRLEGVYKSAASRVLFDLDADGRFDDETEKSAELYTPQEKYVNLGGASYEFEVDAYGESLTLRRLPEKLPDRGLLEPGRAAPEFSFTDADGRPRRLSDFRGKTVLLEFWASWCPACRADAPKLSALYPRLRESGFEVIGVNVNDEETGFRNFVGYYKMPWAHAREGAGGRLQKIFRAHAFPAYYLIAPDGTILASRIKSADLFAEIERRLNK